MAIEAPNAAEMMSVSASRCGRYHVARKYSVQYAHTSRVGHTPVCSVPRRNVTAKASASRDACASRCTTRDYRPVAGGL